MSVITSLYLFGCVASEEGASKSSRDVTDATVDSANLCSDSDNDGWGWNGYSTCAIEPTNSPNTDSTTPLIPHENIPGEPNHCQKIDSGDYHITELVTDVFLTAGQSNATGNKTLYDPDQYREDKLNNRLIVWTEYNKWEIANPEIQTWHNGKYPSGRGQFSNHPGFQIGRAIADLDECRVIALIATAASGMAIDHWRNNEENHYSEISNKVTEALNALPGRYKLDMIWWMQGEADDDEIVSRYVYKLTDLIATFRSENWFSNTGYFLANETRLHLFANEAIRTLNSDGDIFTDYSRGENTSTDSFSAISTEEPGGVHFSADSLRKIGELVAGKYVNEYLPMVKNNTVR